MSPYAPNKSSYGPHHNIVEGLKIPNHVIGE
jgi:hypothetical protein